MVLYATGLNAWNQLQFEKPSVDEPDDIPSFICVLREDAIDCIRPFLSYTTIHDGKQTLKQYPSIRNLLSNDNTTPSHTFPNLPDITQLVAYDTGFAALSATGQVRTWGDERYTACLGREPTDDSPAQTPSLVTDLDDLPTGPITKLAAGGYLLAALTAGHDLYCWGGHAGRAPFLGPDLSDTPAPVVIDDKDIADVAVGEAHMLVLTIEGEVYVIGDNANGQLGLPGGLSSVKIWTRIDLGSVLGGDAGESVVTGVAAGPRNSFLMVQKKRSNPNDAK
ncbi:E3 ubiquitin-protein ligase HERC2 [Chaetomidium leptoderma]|uniref:E3 ubiquitin-protein ligase HERC2 n=1 Tax=Chaetomidium leptoderma TaxID=669021 RepID=A0AAN6VRG6_9PEZI|nr:E3 ubiquitin-protein ligase HERC2 [Chaetomidium leptoderma]